MTNAPLKVQIQKAKASVPEDRANIMRLVDPDLTEVGSQITWLKG